MTLSTVEDGSTPEDAYTICSPFKSDVVEVSLKQNVIRFIKRYPLFLYIYFKAMTGAKSTEIVERRVFKDHQFVTSRH